MGTAETALDGPLLVEAGAAVGLLQHSGALGAADGRSSAQLALPDEWAHASPQSSSAAAARLLGEPSLRLRVKHSVVQFTVIAALAEYVRAGGDGSAAVDLWESSAPGARRVVVSGSGHPSGPMAPVWLHVELARDLGWSAVVGVPAAVMNVMVPTLTEGCGLDVSHAFIFCRTDT